MQRKLSIKFNTFYHSKFKILSFIIKTLQKVGTEGTYLNIKKAIYNKPTVAAADKSLQSCLTLCDPTNCSPPGSSVHRILQARILEWVATSFSKIKTAAAAAKSLQSCPTLCDPIEGSPLGSPVPRILQARTLEWVAISFSNA